jgi:HSP20 family molecular chaperone IbpA
MPTLRESLRNLPDAVFADLLESEDAYRLVVDAAGVAPETLDASAERGRLRVSARREKEVPEEFRYRAEERALFVDFEVPLPPDAAARVGSTDVDRGVVTVTVPKRGRESGVAVPVTSDAEEEPIIGEQSDAGEPAADDDNDDTENGSGPTGAPDTQE